MAQNVYECMVIFDPNKYAQNPGGLAETIPGPSTERLAPLARELGVVIIASLFEKRAAGLYHNTAVVIGADGEIQVLWQLLRKSTEAALPARQSLGEIGVQIDSAWRQRQANPKQIIFDSSGNITAWAKGKLGGPIGLHQNLEPSQYYSLDFGSGAEAVAPDETVMTGSGPDLVRSFPEPLKSFDCFAAVFQV